MTTAVDSFIHRFVPGADARHPALLLLHGTGGNEDDLLPLGEMLAPGAAILSPRGRVLEHGMPRFFRRFAEGVFDVADLKHRAHELADWVIVAVAAHQIGDRPLVAVGFSNGANIAAALLLLRPEVLAGAALLRVTVPFEPEAAPDLTGRALFIAEGRADPYVPVADAERLATMLERAGAEVTLRWSEAGHALTPGDVSGAREWFAGRHWR